MEDCYCLDTSFCINGWHKYYRIDVFPAVWDHVDVCMDRKFVFSCREVYDELLEQEDNLSEWAKRRKRWFLEPDSATFEAMSKVMAANRNFSAVGGSLGKADPWVVAQALVTGAIIVTDEDPNDKRRDTKPPKIPDVCEKHNLRWITPIDFLARIGLNLSTPDET